jgi:hypothetical protein
MLLATGLAGGALIERNFGPGAVYLDMEDTLTNGHVSSDVTHDELQDACLASMASRLGDQFTVYHPPERNKNDNSSQGGAPAKTDKTDESVPSSVTWSDLPIFGHRFAIVKITDFSGEHHVARDFQKTIYEGELDAKQGLVLDLRGNLGGHVWEAVYVASAWVGENLVCRLIERDGTMADYFGKNQATLSHLPLAVLVDGNTASAAEILAGALRDYGLGRLIGTKTYGKGVASIDVKLSNGSKLTLINSRWYTPHGHSVQGVGLVPDDPSTVSFFGFCSIDGSGEEVEGLDHDLQRAIVWLKMQTHD